MKYFFLIVCFPFAASAQRFSATVDVGLLNIVGPKAVVVSDDDGNIAFLKNLGPAPYRSDLNIDLPVPAGPMFSLTYLHEVPANESPNKTPYLEAVTYYHVPHRTRINMLPGRQLSKWEPAVVNLQFKNVKSIQDLIVDAPGKSRERGTRFLLGGLSVQCERAPGDDVFIVLRANKEEHFRYYYLPAGETPPREIDFETLPEDLEIRLVDVPEGCNIVNIHATNETTGNGCLLFAAVSGIYSPSAAVEVFLPMEYSFFDFEVWTQEVKTSKSKNLGFCSDATVYRIKSDTLPEMVLRPDQELDIAVVQQKNHGFDLQLNNAKDAWIATSTMANAKADQSFGKAPKSRWDVAGCGETKVNWRPPVLPADVTESFQSLTLFAPGGKMNVQVVRVPEVEDFWENPEILFDASTPNLPYRTKTVGCFGN